MLARRWAQPIAVALATTVLPFAQATIPTASLAELVNKPYLELARVAPTVELSRAARDAMRKQLQQQRKAENERLKKEEKDLDRQLKELREQLASLNREASTDSPRTAEVRRRVHCQILRLEKLRSEKRVEREQGMPVAFENKLAKIDFLERWPAEKSAIDAKIAAGKARQRRYGDVEDIGVREISKDQQKDIKLGEDAQREMKTYGLMPPELEDKDVQAYVQGIADRIAANSDVRVPVKVTVLFSPEINAFALPGGFLYVNSGLIEKADSESELAGVMAHELGHVAARHGAKLMKRSTLAGIMYQAAQIAVMVGTGGVGSIGAYYLFQAGFLGLGMVLNLDLLGVSREFEAEADQLGAQYAWKAGYDPRGFITFFDKMASEQGYIKSASFFRTHPPFLERILSTVSEIEYLPKSGDLTVDSSAFQKFKAETTETLHKQTQKLKDTPSLENKPDCSDVDLDLNLDLEESGAGAPPAADSQSASSVSNHPGPKETSCGSRYLSSC